MKPKLHETKAQLLGTAMEAALPAERCARSGITSQYLVCVEIREFTSAIIALLLEARDRSQQVSRTLQAMQET